MFFDTVESSDRLSDFSTDPKMMLQSSVVISKIAEGREEGQTHHGRPGLAAIRAWNFSRWIKGHCEEPFSSQCHLRSSNRASKSTSRYPESYLHCVPRSSRRPRDTHSVKDNTELLLKNEIQVFAVSTAYASFGSYGALSSYASATGGDVHNGATDESMEHAFNRVTEQARRQYILGYWSTNTSAKPGVFAKIEVRTPQKNLKLTYRSGYTRYTAEK